MIGITVFLLMVWESGGSNLASLGIFVITQDKNDLFRLSGFQLDFDMMRPDRLPAVRDRILEICLLPPPQGESQPRYGPRKDFALCIKSGQFFGAGKIGKVIAPFAIFGFVVDHSITISTCPVEKLRWKLVESSQASHRQNSIAEKTDRSAVSARWLVRVQFPDFQVFAQAEQSNAFRLQFDGKRYRMMV